MVDNNLRSESQAVRHGLGTMLNWRLAFTAGLLAILMLPVMSAHAAVIASVDRANVELNESFTLKITVDTSIDVEPDASALEEDFFVGLCSS